MNASRLVSAALLVFATSLSAQTCVWNSERYRERDVVPLTPEERARCDKALAEIEAHRKDYLPAMIEELDFRIEWAADRLGVHRELLLYEAPYGPWDKYVKPLNPPEATDAAAAPSSKSLEELNAEYKFKKQLLYRLEKRISLVAWERDEARNHRDREASYRILEAAALAGGLSWSPGPAPGAPGNIFGSRPGAMAARNPARPSSRPGPLPPIPVVGTALSGFASVPPTRIAMRTR
jgi:hypothetical protein